MNSKNTMAEEASKSEEKYSTQKSITGVKRQRMKVKVKKDKLSNKEPPFKF